MQKGIATLNMLLPYDPVVTLLGFYPRELKTYGHTEIYTIMFIADLFITSKTQKQPRLQWANGYGGISRQ